MRMVYAPEESDFGNDGKESIKGALYSTVIFQVRV